MKGVTSELNAAYAEYEAGDSSGLPYEMYERFVELLQGCRAWMKEPEVVLLTEEEYARRVHPETARTSWGVPQAVGGGRGINRSIWDQVDELTLKIRTMDDVIGKLGDVVEGHRAVIETHTHTLETKASMAASDHDRAVMAANSATTLDVCFNNKVILRSSRRWELV